MRNKQYEVDYSKDYQRVHDLVYEYKNGSMDAADKLLESFAKFLSNYAVLIKYGKYNLNYYSVRSFIKLFIEDPKDRKLLNSHFYNQYAGKNVVFSTINTIMNIFHESSSEDIKQDLKIIFFNMCQKYKDVRPSFHTYIDKNFHYYAYRYWEKTIRDPIGRGSSVSISTPIKSIKFVEDTNLTFADILEDVQSKVENDYTLNKITVYYDIKTSSIPVAYGEENSDTYNNTFLNTNWINGITCSTAFKILTPLERKIIKLWYIDNLTDKEIGDKFGICRGSINKRRNIAKTKIGEYLKYRKVE
ncbi:sigma factor-like helix-turn-helix DNA-binding protein [Clostridium saccharoperbutylacetonicum]